MEELTYPSPYSLIMKMETPVFAKMFKPSAFYRYPEGQE
jgi:hypothetical protein